MEVQNVTPLTAPTDVSVVVATFGNRSDWQILADRAVDSAFAAGAKHVHHVHGATLHEARNDGAARVETPWLCFLDADDELEPGYVEAMVAYARAEPAATLLAPLARYVHKDGREEPPRIPPGSLDLRNSNTLVIGAVHPKRIFEAVGGFRDWPFYEDWCYWQRCWKLGCTVAYVAGAIYRAHVRANSRNRRPRQHQRTAVHHAIRRANFPELYANANANAR